MLTGVNVCLFGCSHDVGMGCVSVVTWSGGGHVCIVGVFSAVRNVVVGSQDRGWTGPQTRWRVEGGRDVPPAKVELFLEEWCLQWPRVETQTEWAERNGVTPRTLNNWLRDERFLRLWRERADQSYASPEMTSPLIAKTYEVALNASGEATVAESLKATEVYAKFVNMVSPTVVEHRVQPVSQVLAAMPLNELVEIAGGGDDVIDVDSMEVDREWE